MKNVYFLMLALGMVTTTQAQLSFSNANNRLSSPAFFSGVAIGVTDVNGDGLDDIVRLAQGRQLNIELQSSQSSLFTNTVYGTGGGQSQWSLCVADVDNNGHCDVLTGGAYDGVKLYKSNEDGSAYNLSILPGATLFIQGSNLADINNDGWLDFFACHDDGESRIWANDGAGGFVPADDWIDMATVPVSDNSGNYGSIWTDFDNDGDLDLYIAKCRQGVNDPTDPRRINALYVNNGQGQFTESAAASNLKIGAQSWTADFGDIDNDGDLDCFITNHDVPSMLLINDGQGVFTDITATSGIVVQGLPIQGVMRDFDNDGFLDILVAGTQQYLFHNNGDQTFSPVTGLFDANQMESFAIGDLNHDGYLDIYGGYAQVYTTPSNISDVLWLNNGGSNHFFSVKLQGTTSNRDGVGARVEIYGAWGKQIREVRAGESYGIMNSMMQHFGLGEHTQVDSLIIRWPSGHVDKFEELVADQFISVTEDNCISPPAVVVSSGSTVICSGQAVVLSAPEGYNYVWSNGETSSSISVTQSGTYQVSVSEGSDCFSVSQSIEIVVNPDETPSIEALGETTFCRGGSVVLNASAASSYQWSNGGTSAQVEVTESGSYTVTTQGLCESFTSAPVEITVLSSPTPSLVSITPDVDSVTIEVTGDQICWYLDETTTEAFDCGTSIRAPLRDTSFTVYAQGTTLYAGNTYTTGMIDHAGGNYSGNQFNGGIIFDCYEPFTLQSVKVYTDVEGSRIIELVDAAGNVLASKEVVVPVGIYVIDLNFEVPVGTNLFLGTNTAHNLSVFGYNSARLRRSDENINYPYEVEGIVKIKDSNLGSNRYYYFFDWRIKEADFLCSGERVAVPVVLVDSDDLTLDAQGVKVYPNPTSGLLQVEATSTDELSVRVLHVTGQVVWQGIVSAAQPSIDLSNQAAGVYWLQINHQNRIYCQKVIKH